MSTTPPVSGAASESGEAATSQPDSAASRTSSSAAERPPRPKKVRLPHLRRLKERGEPIVMVTAYDYPTARAAEESGAEILLVGDSLANVVQGLDTTLPVTLDEMIYHARCVRRGLRSAMLVADMPFLSYQVGLEDALQNAGRLMKEAGAEAVKVEGAGRLLPFIAAMVEMGIPVMGHLGLTPQSVHALGGYRVQGRDESSAERLQREALELEKAGIFALVLELVPADLARKISQSLTIPTIGIGAGGGCDGQVLVWHDVLGFREDAPARFCKVYAKLWDAALEGLKSYGRDVKERRFPASENEY
jgi:3-methyl-2-oxobutanoate hydroxymethyltransferase